MQDQDYFNQLKEMATRIDPLTQHILNEMNYFGLVGHYFKTHTVLSDRELADIIHKTKMKSFDAGYDAGAKDATDIAKISDPGGHYVKGLHSGAETGLAVGIAYTALVAIFVAGAVYVYKNYMSKAAKACNKKKGIEKKVCMAKYRADALQAKYKVYLGNAKHCAKSKNPAKCKALLAQKAEKVKNELRKVKAKK